MSLERERTAPASRPSSLPPSIRRQSGRVSVSVGRAGRRGFPALVAEALADLGAGVRLRDAGIALAREEISDAHRRTTLGPAWLLINYLALVATFGMIFGSLMGVGNYLAYVALGLLVFNHISDTMSLSVTLFMREESFIRGTTLPLSVYVIQMNLQLIIRSAWAAVGCLGVLVLAGVPLHADWIWSLVGIALVLVAAPAATIVFAVLGTLLPDLQFIVVNALRVLMFITPVVWTNGDSPLRNALYHGNPLTHFLDAVRRPILDGGFPATALLVAGATTMALWIAAILLLGAWRRRIVFMI